MNDSLQTDLVLDTKSSANSDELNVITSWTNGRKAVVELVANRAGEKFIRKVYRPGFAASMWREYLATSYIARCLTIVPRVLAFRPLHNELRFSYLEGERVLEWVLQRFGPDNLSLADFHSFHGLDPEKFVDPRVAAAFDNFRKSDSAEARGLKDALRASYSRLHNIHVLHGSPDPRNVLYKDGQIFLIDFDHSRPSVDPASIDYQALQYWYGLAPAEPTRGNRQSMRHSRSGEYKLPSAPRRFGGNVLLRAVRWAPGPLLKRLASGRFYYQAYDASQVGDDHQGLSANKLTALNLPDDMRGKSVLDLGCAEGFFSVQCAKRGASRVLGVDSSLGRLISAALIARKERLDIRYKMAIFPTQRLRGTFDYVLCLSVLHHSLSQKDVWKVLTQEEFSKDREILRQQLRLLRSMTATSGRCILEIPYEYDDPSAERPMVDFNRFVEELEAAGFRNSRSLGTWEYNPNHRRTKDRIIYVAEA